MLNPPSSSFTRNTPEEVTIVPVLDSPPPPPPELLNRGHGTRTEIADATTGQGGTLNGSTESTTQRVVELPFTSTTGTLGTPVSGGVTASSSSAAFHRPSAFENREEWRPSRRLRSAEYTQQFNVAGAEESMGGTVSYHHSPSLPAHAITASASGDAGGSGGPSAWFHRLTSVTGSDPSADGSSRPHAGTPPREDVGGPYEAPLREGTWNQYEPQPHHDTTEMAETAEGEDGDDNTGSGMRHASDANHEKYQEIVNNCIIHLTRPIENLPRIGPEELKVIGRCITFEAETLYQGEVRKMHYSGLVSTICCETVSLIHVQRFSDKSFEAFMEQKRANDSNNAVNHPKGKEEEMSGNADGPTTGGQGSSVTSTNDVGGTVSGGNHNVSTCSSSHRPPSPLTPSSPFSFSVTDYQHTGFIGMIATPTHREKLHEVQEDFMAPFMTFSRKRIHNVQFSIDPSSRFYSLFRHTSKHIIDMQCLRMFVRRYIVHTSQGNNPRNVPLKAFIVCRCNCPKVEDQLLERIAREEIYYLLKLDGEIQRMTARIQHQEQHREEGNHDLELRYMLHMRRFAQDTLLVGVLEIFFMFLIILIRWSWWTEMWILGPYLQKFTSSCLMYWFFTLVLGFITSAHGRFISPFNSTPHVLKLLRMLFCIISLYWCVIMLVMGSRVASNSNLKHYMENYVGVNSYELTQLYNRYHCSGYNTICKVNEESVFCRDSIGYQYAFPCGPLLRSELRRTVVPVMTVGMASVVLLGLDLFTLYRYSSNRFRQF